MIRAILFLIIFSIYSCNDRTTIKKSEQSEILSPPQATSYEVRYKARLDSLKKLANDSSLFFPRQEFKKVLGFTFNKGIIEEGILDHSIYNLRTKTFAKSIDQKDYKLKEGDINELLNLINDTVNFQPGESGCFIPHHAFVFYDSRDSVIAFINICLMCKQTSAYPEYPIMLDGGLTSLGHEKFQSFCNNIGMPNYSIM